MRRKITVYGLRFSKTSFWNRLNTGFLEPAVATALTACGIETQYYIHISTTYHMYYWIVATALTACGIETHSITSHYLARKLFVATALTACGIETAELYSLTMAKINCTLQQHLPLAVLKLLWVHCTYGSLYKVATALTACGIETHCQGRWKSSPRHGVATALTACGIET